MRRHLFFDCYSGLGMLQEVSFQGSGHPSSVHPSATKKHPVQHMSSAPVYKHRAQVLETQGFPVGDIKMQFYISKLISGFFFFLEQIKGLRGKRRKKRKPFL